MTSKIKLPDGQEASDGDFVVVFEKNDITNERHVEEIFEVKVSEGGHGGAIESVWIDANEEKERRLTYDEEISLVKDVLSIEKSGAGSMWVRDDVEPIEEKLQEKYGTSEFEFSVAGRTKVAVRKIKEILSPD